MNAKLHLETDDLHKDEEDAEANTHNQKLPNEKKNLLSKGYMPILIFFLFAIVFLMVYFPLLLSLSNPGELCGDTSIDAIFTNSKGETFVFLGSKFWKISNNSIASGYPRSISVYWPGVPDDIDAAGDI